MNTWNTNPTPKHTGPRLADLPSDDARLWYDRAESLGFPCDDDTRTDEIDGAEAFVCDAALSRPWADGADLRWIAGPAGDDGLPF